MTILAAAILCLLQAQPLPAQAAGAPATPGAPDTTIVSLELPPDLPEELSVSVVHDGRTRELRLRRHSLRAPGAIVRVLGASGSPIEVPPPPARTYRGRVTDEPDAIVLATLTEAGLSATISSPSAPTWSIRPLVEIEPGADRALHLVFEQDQAGIEGFDCATCGGKLPSVPAPPAPLTRSKAPGTSAALGGGCGLSLCEIAFDADFEYYQAKGSSVPQVVAAIDGIMNQVDFFYARDVLITYQITAYVVRTSPFYNPTSGGDLLNQFVAEWTTNQASVPRDIAHLMTGKPGSIIQYGGLAYVAVVCNFSFGYGWSMDSAGIVGHEVGHNWAAGHCHDTSPCNNMCGACLYIAPKTKEIIEAHRDSRTCLDVVGPYATPAPPYAHPEALTTTRNDLAQMGSIAIDVLGNDHDANCDPLSIDAFDATSPRGASLSISPGTGPNGRDELLYTPSWLFVGEDSFAYTVGDGTGLQATGRVTVTVTGPGILAWWRLDDGSGAKAHDSSRRSNHGALAGGPTWTAGTLGGALDFDSNLEYVSIAPSPDLEFGAVRDFSVAFWIRTGGWSGAPPILTNKNWASGSNPGWVIACQDDGLTWQWNLRGDVSGPVDFDQGGLIADGQWHHIAVTHNRDALARFYQDGVKIGQRSISGAGDVDTGLPLAIAQDGTLAHPQALVATLDDVRIYGEVLTVTEVSNLHQGVAQKALAPDPPDGTGFPASGGFLSWEPAPAAASREVYFGTDYTAVGDATPVSPEYRGGQAAAVFATGPLSPDTGYYWRVDEIDTLGVTKGDVWSFVAVGSLDGGLKAAWPLDEGTGTTVANAAGPGLVGSLVQMSEDDWILKGKLCSALHFDGAADGWVAVGPKAPLRPSGAVTVAAWVRPDAFDEYAGIAGYAVDTGATESGYFLHLRSGGAFGWAVAVVGGGMTYFTTPGGHPTGEWHHVVATYDGSAALIYVNGREVAGGSLAGAIDWSPDPIRGFMIGRWADDDEDHRLDGAIDDVAVWSRALAPVEVDVLYGAGAGRPVTGGGPGAVWLTKVLAKEGPYAGGNTVTLFGKCFTSPADTTVTFGGVPATVVAVVGPRKMKVVVPPAPPAPGPTVGGGPATGRAVLPRPVDVVVTNGLGSATLAGGYTYTPGQ